MRECRSRRLVVEFADYMNILMQNCDIHKHFKVLANFERIVFLFAINAAMRAANFAATDSGAAFTGYIAVPNYAL